MILFPEKLISKYNVPVPRYTSYPPANFFSKDFAETDYVKILEQSNDEKPENISIYFHIPFCYKICHYCGCNTHLSRNQDLMRQYVEAVMKEILMVRKLIKPGRKVSQIHWGGGTPNYLPVEWIEEIMQLIHDNFEYTDKPEVAMECHPGHLDFNYVERLIKCGFNRISLGIQDFSKKVLDTVNRDDTIIPFNELVAYIRTFEGVSINFDFIYGLPHQDAQTFYDTIAQAIELSPDRLVTFSYAHVPWVRRAQKVLEVEGIPNAKAKLQMFEAGYKLLTDNGYHSIGLDHFAKENDELNVAFRNRKLHRNFQGYCTRETTGQVYAFGATGISQLENAYAQNTKDTNTYVKLINSGKFTIEKGYELNLQEKVIREVINEIMCNQYLSWESVAGHYNLSADEVKNFVNYSPDKIKGFEQDGLISFDNEHLEVSSIGRYFMRNIAASFDPALAKAAQKFSKSL